MVKTPSRIAQRIKAARKAAHLTQQDVADRLGMSDVGFGDIERGKSQPNIEYLFQLSSILGRSVEHLLGLDNGLSADEDELLARYRTLPPAQATWFLDSLRGAMGGQHE